MKQSINCHDFINQFDSLRPNNFSREALFMMFDYFEQYERDIGEEIEFDPIAICCEYIEQTIPELVHTYKLEEEISGMEQNEMIDFLINYLEEQCIFIGLTDSGSFVYQQF
jgi:hypothetical protein